MPFALQVALTVFTQTLFWHLLVRLLQKQHASVSFPVIGAIATTIVTHPRCDLPVAVLLGLLLAVALVSHFAVLAMLRNYWPAPPDNC